MSNDSLITPIKQIDLDAFRAIQMKVEKAIAAKCSEYVAHQVHDGVYSSVKKIISPLRDTIAEDLSPEVDQKSTSLRKPRCREDLAEIRSLLDSNALERELQKALVESGLLKLKCEVFQEVPMEKSKDYPGMRMDIVLASQTEEPSEIIELKRGNHLIVARRGKPSEHLSKVLQDAINQNIDYGNRIQSDAKTVINLEKDIGYRLENIVLRLIAGRRLPDANSYSLLSAVTAGNSMQLQITTWDGLLAELERIFD
jgi:hypothetical protein